MSGDLDAYRLLAGVDEVGRGPLAGDVVAAAVILDPAKPIDGLADSKKISAGRRARLYQQIREQALDWAIGRASVEEIDSLNILRASLLAMSRAIDGLRHDPEMVAVDGNQCPPCPWPVRAIVGGDASVAAISAASILAKVTRDAELEQMEREYPGYGLAQHKGYPTKQHLEALAQLGPCAIHRHSFGPVKRLLAQGG
jgi:ribonuclease HII